MPVIVTILPSRRFIASSSYISRCLIHNCLAGVSSAVTRSSDWVHSCDRLSSAAPLRSASSTRATMTSLVVTVRHSNLPLFDRHAFVFFVFFLPFAFSLYLAEEGPTFCDAASNGCSAGQACCLHMGRPQCYETFRYSCFHNLLCPLGLGACRGTGRRCMTVVSCACEALTGVRPVLQSVPVRLRGRHAMSLWSPPVRPCVLRPGRVHVRVSLKLFYVVLRIGSFCCSCHADARMVHCNRCKR